MSRITVEQLYASYGTYLRAKVQEIEFQGWGPGMFESLRDFRFVLGGGVSAAMPRSVS